MKLRCRCTKCDENVCRCECARILLCFSISIFDLSGCRMDFGAQCLLTHSVDPNIGHLGWLAQPVHHDDVC